MRHQSHAVSSTTKQLIMKKDESVMLKKHVEHKAKVNGPTADFSTLTLSGCNRQF